uniref:Ig-like domain-containing protein n=1 Tax=Neogobius melanostomus TaxID=47308 RepID=A0A8C6TIX8_9GOBI
MVLSGSHLLIFFLPAVFIQGLNIVIKSQQTDVAVKAGEEACLQCPLSYSTDVLQVMWQKILPEEGEVTVATCHPHRYKLNPDFSTKIGLKETTLRNCSIVVQNVTEQDEGCYLCLFITSSDVAYYGKACLHMYELHKPTLNTSRSNSTGQLEVSCSATGRPAPNVTIHVQKTIWTHTNAVKNSNGTVTVIRTAALSPLHMNKTLECSATSSFGSERNRMTVPDFEDTYTEDDSTLALCIGLFLFCGCVVAVAVLVWLLVRKQLEARADADVEDNINKNKEVMQGTPRTPRTPLNQCVKEENETLRKRTPMIKKNNRTAKTKQNNEARLLLKNSRKELDFDQ